MAVLATTVLLLAGCEPPNSRPTYNVLRGAVETCHRDTGEMTVQVERTRGREIVTEALHCIVTKDTEVYIDDRFSSFDGINPGDRVELVGYHDPGPRADRFVVSFVHVQRARAP